MRHPKYLQDKKELKDFLHQAIRAVVRLVPSYSLWWQFWENSSPIFPLESGRICFCSFCCFLKNIFYLYLFSYFSSELGNMWKQKKFKYLDDNFPLMSYYKLYICFNFIQQGFCDFSSHGIWRNSVHKMLCVTQKKKPHMLNFCLSHSN